MMANKKPAPKNYSQKPVVKVKENLGLPIMDKGYGKRKK
jgi:hypothetical protein